MCNEIPWHEPPSDHDDDDDNDNDEEEEEEEEEEEGEEEGESEEDDPINDCIICGATLQSLFGLFSHYDSVHRPPVVCVCREICDCKTECTLCQKVVATRGLSQHMLYAHGERLCKLTCPICARVFTTSGSRDNHMRRDHA